MHGNDSGMKQHEVLQSTPGRIIMLVREGHVQVLQSMLSRSMRRASATAHESGNECDVTYKQRGGEQKLTYRSTGDIESIVQRCSPSMAVLARDASVGS